MHVSLRPLFGLHDLASVSARDMVQLTPKMSGIEEDPRNDWLHVALAEFLRLKRDRGQAIKRAAFIGSGNGIDVIAALRIFDIQSLIVTDIVDDIIQYIERNIVINTTEENIPADICFAVGRDCEPIAEPCDFIYANLPLIMASEDDLVSDLATTTLTDSRAYLHLGRGEDDLLVRWSLLPQLGFLLSAKDKLAPSGVIITLIGGRIPDEAITECFERAGMDFDRGTVAVMRQSDQRYVEQYALYENSLSRSHFLFYDEEKAARILISHGYRYPSILNLSGEHTRDLLAPSALTAAEAWASIQAGHSVGHLSYGFRTVPKT